MIRATRFALLVVAALGLAGIASMAIAQPAPPGAIYQTSTARLIGPQPPQCCVTNWMTTKPIAEYSFRRLNASYNGPDILVRRASDNAQQAIYFWHDWVNLKALMSFCSATSCYLVTWYDQSGNGYDATQTTAADQGIVVNNGSLVTRVGKPALDASNASAGLAIPASASATGSAPSTYVAVATVPNLAAAFNPGIIGFGSFSSTAATWRALISSENSNYLDMHVGSGNSIYASMLRQDVLFVATALWQSGALDLYYNGSSVGSSNAILNTSSGAGYIGGGSVIMELMIFSTALSDAQRQQIEHSDGLVYGIAGQ